jgi:hypothetical protein
VVLLSCTNCCFNGLQADGFGAKVGYCVEHRAVLHAAESLTCGRLFRRDLLLPEANTESKLHQRKFSRETIVHLRTRVDARVTGHADDDVSVLVENKAGKEVTDYGRLGTKIVSLSRLSMIPGARAELARLSLSRTYVRRCVERGGDWTSGIHQLLWTIDRLLEPPDIGLDDLRDDAPVPQTRQRELAQWSIVMLRLTFISDVGHLAPDSDDVASLRDLPESAATAVDEVDFGELMKWVTKQGWAAAIDAFPRDRYEELTQELHRDLDDPTAGIHHTGSNGGPKRASSHQEPSRRRRRGG